MPTTITDITVRDIRFPTSRDLDGSDAMNPDPDYSCAYASIEMSGDDPTGNDTSCVATRCSANERVASNVCVACGAQETNVAGDDASGADTSCDRAPPPSSSARAAMSVCPTLFAAVVGAAAM